MTRTGRPPRTGSLRRALSERVVVADGDMGTMLQASAATLDDFGGHEGCNEILNVTRPDIVSSVHEAYLEAGVDCVTTNTFGANLSNLGEYGIAERIDELSEAGARIARTAADRPPGVGPSLRDRRLPEIGDSRQTAPPGKCVMAPTSGGAPRGICKAA